GSGQPGACRGGQGSPRQAPLRLLLHQIFLALARRADLLPNDQDCPDRVRIAIALSLATQRDENPPAALTFDLPLIGAGQLLMRLTSSDAVRGFRKRPLHLLPKEEIVEVHWRVSGWAGARYGSAT